MKRRLLREIDSGAGRAVDVSEELMSSDWLQFKDDLMEIFFSVIAVTPQEDIEKISQKTEKIVGHPVLAGMTHFLTKGNFKGLAPDDPAILQMIRLKDEVMNCSPLQIKLYSHWTYEVSKIYSANKAYDKMRAEYPEGMDDPPYGRFIFAPARYGKVPPEENTKREDDAYKALDLHFNANRPVSQDVALELMRSIEAGAYSDILKEPNTEYVYRGMRMIQSELEEFFGLTDDDFLERRGSKVLNRMMKVSREEGSSAWTVSLDEARRFSRAIPGRYSVVLVARVADNPLTFLSGPNGLYNIQAFTTFQDEKEAVALGSVKVFKAYWSRAKNTGDMMMSPVEEENSVKEGVSLLRAYMRLILEQGREQKRKNRFG